MAQDDYDALDNGVLPWHRLGHAPISLLDKEHFGVVVHQGRPHGIKSPPSPVMNSPVMVEGQTRSREKSERRRYESSWACSGPGMQAIFLGPNKRTCGTGVFIPRGHATHSQLHTKPAYSPVLLPSRVVQALNLNVHELGQNIKPQPDQKKNTPNKIDEKLEKKKEDYVTFSPEIFLPEEWTY